MFSMAPPEGSGLNVDSAGVDLINESFSSVSESSGRIGGSNEPQFSIGVWILQNCEGLFEWIESVSHSVPHITVKIGLSYPSMNYGSHY